MTEDGILIAASASSSQLGPYALGAGKLILVVGSQKIVPDLGTALRRLREYVLPWEDESLLTARACPVDHGTGSRSQIRIDARSTVPWYMNSRLS